MNTAQIAVVGGGIVGLAHAYAAAKRGYKVVLFEREQQANGASVRNFGTIWCVGQSAGEMYDRAMFGRETWLTVAEQAGLWCNPSGSLHLAYHADEWAVLEEYYETVGRERGVSNALLARDEVLAKSRAANPDGLIGGLWSSTELTVYSREAIRRIPHWLAERYGVELRFGQVVKQIELPIVETSKETWHVERVFVCSGTDFETLYPDSYAASGIMRCKLQMLRTVPQPDHWQLGAILCGGLTLAHYDVFKDCAALPALKERFAADLPEHVTNGIHVLLAQTPAGELTIGDSHHYNNNVDPFNKEHIDQLILDYLATIARFPSWQIAERWYGVYPKIQGQPELVLHPAPNVTIANAFGTGMTLAFSMAEANCANL